MADYNTELTELNTKLTAGIADSSLDQAA